MTATRRHLVEASVACAVGLLVVAVLVLAGWGPLADLDSGWSARAYAFTVGHPAFESAVRVVTALGDGWTVSVLTAAVAIALAARGRWLLGWWLVLTVAGSALLSTALKHGLERVRPPSTGGLADAHGFSFPSGHTQAATVTFTAVVLVVGWQVLRPGPAARAASAAAVVVVIAAVGLSRVFLGVHWPSDVLGGWLSGSAWVTGATAVLLGLLPAEPGGSGMTDRPVSDLRSGPRLEP